MSTPSITERKTSPSVRRDRRAGAAHLEVVMTTAVMLPLAIGLLLLGIQMCRYAYGALAGLMLLPGL